MFLVSALARQPPNELLASLRGGVMMPWVVPMLSCFLDVSSEILRFISSMDSANA